MNVLRLGLCVVLMSFTSLSVTVAGQTEDEPQKYRVERDIVYSTVDDVDLRLDAYLPDGNEKKYPGILVVHGGAWSRGSKSQLALYAAALARRGYASFAINYRLAPKHQFPAQIEDCRNAVRWMRKNAGKYHMDAQRIGAIGYSAGGHLVTLLACTAHQKENVSTQVQAVVAGGAPCDFRETPRQAQFLTFWLGGSRRELPEVYIAASPVAFVSKNSPPMFFFHGEVDRLVKLDSPRRMVKALLDAKVDASIHTVPKGGHIGAAMDSTALDKAWNFFDKHLQDVDP